MILTRKEFIDYFKTVDSRIDGNDPQSPLWAAENVPSDWFVCIPPIGIDRFKWSYWSWCNSTLKGKVSCYSSSHEEQKEWWGFTDRDDIVLWMLKWM